VSAPPAGTAQPTWADVNHDVDRTLLTAGNTYFAWMTLIALILAGGVAAWAWQIWVGLGVAGIRTPQMWRSTSPTSCSGSVSATRAP
jgi:hypothetical protein